MTKFELIISKRTRINGKKFGAWSTLQHARINWASTQPETTREEVLAEALQKYQDIRIDANAELRVIVTEEGIGEIFNQVKKGC